MHLFTYKDGENDIAKIFSRISRHDANAFEVAIRDTFKIDGSLIKIVPKISNKQRSRPRSRSLLGRFFLMGK